MADRTYAAAYPVGAPEGAIAGSWLRRISWGAVIAGAVIVLAVHIALSLLGLGIGLSTVDVAAGDTPQASSMGIGAGIWWVVSNLIALFIGGYVAARLSGIPVRGDGIIHGVLTWAVTLLVTLYLLTTSIGSVVGGAFNVVKLADRARQHNRVDVPCSACSERANRLAGCLDGLVPLCKAARGSGGGHGHGVDALDPESTRGDSPGRRPGQPFDGQGPKRARRRSPANASAPEAAR